MEHVLQQFRERIAAAAAGVDGGALRIVGSGSKDWYGNALHGEPFDVRAYTGIVSYEPTELVVTARCGTPVTEIEAALAAQRQMLAFEPPHFGSDATIGGVLACGLSGPRRANAGALRDFVLGAALIDGRGEVLHFGGQVMKNVAGYDISRLLAGSMGMLGLVLEVSLKVLPLPIAETSLRFDMDQAEAIHRLNAWGGQPLPVSASVWHGGVLQVRLSGAAAAVDAARKKMGGQDIGVADDLWADVREQRHAFFAFAQREQAALWRLSLPSATPPLDLPGETLIEWGGAQRWLCVDARADAARIRAAALAAGGHATLFRGGDKAVGVFQPLTPAVAALHRNLKKAFDPAGIFNRGRMFVDL